MIRFISGLGAVMAIAGLAASCQDAHADTTIGLHIGSWHSEPGFNNRNPGLYINHNGWTAGGYRNSIRKDSFYAGYTFQSPEYGPFRAGITLGGITGYRSRLAPLVAPSLSVNLGKSAWNARIFYLPKVKFTGSHVLHLSIERKF